jgi:hypothetical protein
MAAFLIMAATSLIGTRSRDVLPGIFEKIDMLKRKAV